MAKLLFLAKRARPDILVAVAFLTTRVTVADSHDLKKLGRVLKYINGTRDMALLITPEALDEVRVYVDASYGSHVDAKSHTGRALTLGRGVLTASSSKQKIVTKSSTEAEMVGLSDSIGDGVSAAQFMQSLGYNMKPTVFYQDNMSTIKLAENGASSSHRTKHMNVRYFFIKDRIDSREIAVEYMHTKSMWADILSKPVQGKLFVDLRDRLMGAADASDAVSALVLLTF